MGRSLVVTLDEGLGHAHSMFECQMDSSPNERITAEGKAVWYGERIESRSICLFKGQCITPALYIGKDWWRQLFVNERYDTLCYVLHECFVRRIPMLVAILRS